MRKTNLRKVFLAAGLGIGFSVVALGQEQTSRVTVPFSDPNRPRTLVVNLIQGSVTVRGYNGNDAIVEGLRTPRRQEPESHAGMHRIGGPASMDVTEENNVITVHGGVMQSSDLTIQVPVQTSLRLKTVNGGKIVVEGITGDVEAENINGPVSATGVSGSVVASSTNGKVTASLDRITPNKNMSFSTLNGAIDLTLPADTKANLRMRTDNGEIWSDFDVKVDGSRPAQTVEEQKGSRHRVRTDNTVFGSINGGGPEIQIRTFNGSIYLHKK